MNETSAFGLFKELSGLCTQRALFPALTTLSMLFYWYNVKSCLEEISE
jgi:hypothetical protein